MALAQLSSTKPRIIQLLNANRLSYAATVGTGANAIGAFKYDQEVTDALIQADGIIITDDYFMSDQPQLRNRFLTDSPNLADGAKIPEFHGKPGRAEWSTDGITWKASQAQASKDDVVQMTQLGAYIGSTAKHGMHFISDEGYVFHGSPYFRISYPAYTKTTALQALEAHEPAIIACALGLLYKDNSVAAHQFYWQQYMFLSERVRAGSVRMGSYMPRPVPAELRGN